MVDLELSAMPFQTMFEVLSFGTNESKKDRGERDITVRSSMTLQNHWNNTAGVSMIMRSLLISTGNISRT